ncbi:(deoxy)nucleoside triphosphate pyrophosphohydrolase [Planctomicrobium sp. SH661]|uniref:(deoxy)nucleoside triphosphate pyrophosphohydrolase n=1 Tax=Planctomicrobium sp. SH661 TaxID=3448124 RepID=UPI003F5BD6F9
MTTHPGSTDQESSRVALRIGVAIVEHSGCVLVGVRDAETVLAGKHEFPGGKCLEGETPAACALRECFEETGLRVEVVELINHVQHRYEHGSLDLSFFLCRPAEPPSQPAGNFRWTPISELAHLNFPEGNRIAVQKLLDRFGDSGTQSRLA